MDDQKRNDIGTFTLAIQTQRTSNGEVFCNLVSDHHNMPTEIVMMQLKAFLHTLEQDYYTHFD